MKSTKLTILLALLTSSLLLTACSSETLSDEALEELTTQNNLPDTQLEVNAHVIAPKSILLALDFPAIVEEVYVEEGEYLEKGTPLIRLNYESYLAKLKAKETELAINKLQLQQLENNVDPQVAQLGYLKQAVSEKQVSLNENTDSDIESCINSLSLQEETINEAKRGLETGQGLYDAGMLSEAELNALKQTYEVSQKTKEDLSLKLSNLKASRKLEISNLSSQIDALQIQLSNSELSTATQIETLALSAASNQLALDDLQQKLDYAKLQDQALVAPSSELQVTAIHCKVGSRIGETTGALMELMDLSSLTVELDIPQNYKDQVHLGDVVTLDYWGELTAPITGTISQISGLAQEVEGETVIKAQVTITNGLDRLIPGLSMDAVINLEP